MFIFLGKLITPLILPLGVALCLWLAALVLVWVGRPRIGRHALYAGIATVVLASNSLVADALLGALEDDYGALTPETAPKADAIVVLGGMSAPPLPPRETVDVGDAFDRLLHGMHLFRAERASHLVLSGGVIPWLAGSSQPEALRMSALARDYGIPENAIVLEDSSRNTHESAVYCARLLHERGWRKVLLVTSASHMPRTMACFRMQWNGEIVAAPTDIQVVERPYHVARLLPDAQALLATGRAIKEYVGLAAYWLRGWI